MPRALILGGTGAIGRAAALRLARDGWAVDLVGRDPRHVPVDAAAAGARFVSADRHDEPALARALGPGVDLLVDCLCFTAADARTLLTLADDATATVMISSKGVYVDAFGNHANSPDPPRYDGPITEDQPTLAPGDGDYQTALGYGRNKVAAEHVLLDSDRPVTVLRPSKVHGPGARPPREWYFVKRVLDRRPVVLLARGGRSVDQTSAAANLAALIAVVAENPGRRVLNAADPDAPNGRAIARAVAAVLDHDWREVGLADDAPPELGNHPWNRAHPVVLDTAAAVALGYVPVGDYTATVASAVAWLVASCAPRAGGVALPADLDDDGFVGSFDYGAEDRFLAESDGARRG